MSFFSEAKFRFKEVSEDGKIETDSFLKACSEIVPFFDVLGPTTFAPVKMDINGNIKKLRGFYDSNPQKFRTLQDLVDSEINARTTKAKNSATDALLWLKRAMQFILTFLKKVLTGEPDLVKCANIAYERTLKQYHNFIVKGIFNLAVKSVPYRKDFIASLGRGVADELVVLEEMQAFVDELDANIDIIQEYYSNNGLDL
ncbi:glycolipid transfer protein [Exaiptasia diaphana]|uniref:Glycolipid transfer protein domain-containing protein n=1 Tax=Exaiptasia diaphana TaxID=2652724 RepID=A0A913XVU1_EXADI|nr:glycolipid transfer protein [Exaiptasia diaphana]KXJ09056.1 Glycolipid transfer protein [Exaiptasia diaphana]